MDVDNIQQVNVYKPIQPLPQKAVQAQNTQKQEVEKSEVAIVPGSGLQKGSKQANGEISDNPFVAAGQEEASVNESTVENAIRNVNTFMKGSFRELSYSIHEKTRQLIIKVIDSETKEVVREVPPEKNLDLLANIWEMTGILVDKKG